MLPLNRRTYREDNDQRVIEELLGSAVACAATVMAKSSDVTNGRPRSPLKRAKHALNRLLLSVLPIAAAVVFPVGVGNAAQREHHSASRAFDRESPSILWSQTVPLHAPDPCLPVSGSVESRGVAIGPDQDVVAVGSIAGLSTVVVVKYDRSSGERIWCHSFPVRATTANGTAFLVAFAEVGGVAIDASGTIFIGGHGRTGPLPPAYPRKPGPPPPVPASRYFATTCSSAGACASTVTFINPAVAGSHNDTIGGIAIGPDGNPVLTGLAEFPSAFPKKGTFTLLTVKVDGSTLELLGTAQAASKPPRTDSTVGVAVDSSNDIFVTGTEASTLKYDSLLSPIPLWTRHLAGASIATRPPHHDGDEDPGDVDDVAVVRAPPNGDHRAQGFVVTKLDGEAGVTLWTKAYDTDLNIPRDVVWDHRGNILIAGDRGGRGGERHSRLQEGQLVSLSQTGELNWAAVFPTRKPRMDSFQSSFVAVAVGLDGDPVVSGHSEVRPGRPTRVMNTLKYSVRDASPHEPPDEDDDDDGDARPHDNRLAWDQPISETVTGFRVCIDAQIGMACQDVGRPEDLNPRILPSTLPGSRTYEIALSKLTSIQAFGKRRISVIAYNTSGDSPASAALTVAGRFGQHTKPERH